MKRKIIVTLMTLCCFVCFGMPENKDTPYGSGIAQAQDDDTHAQRLVRDLEDAIKSGDQKRILDAHQRVQSHEPARFMLNQKPILLRQLSQVQQSIKAPPTVAGAPAPARAVSAAPAGSRVSVPADSAPPSSGGSKFYVPEGEGYKGSIKVDQPVSGPGPVTSYSQARANIHDIAQQINPQPPDPKQVKEWADSIRRPGSSEPPKQIEKFSGGDPSWSEINRRVTAASEPLYSKDRAIPVRDPDMARLANQDRNYTKGSVDPELARLTGKEPRPPTTIERMDAYQQAQQQAAQRREGLVDALRSGNQDQINRAALQVRQDPLAVKQANISELPEVRTRMNEPVANIQRNMEPGIKEQIAQQYGVKPNEVEVHYTSNPSKEPKVHQDADVTIRVRGMDVPADKARPVVNEQFQRAATEATGGGRATTGMSPDKFAERNYIETTDRLHRHAFGSSATEGEQIIRGPKSQPIRDVRQVTGAMEDKFNVARNQAVELTRQGQLPQAEVQRGLAMDQTVKSFDGQVKPRVEAMGGRVPEHVQKGMDIMRGVKEGRISPAQAEMDLRRMGETPESMTQKATGLLEAGQKLQGPGRGGVPDRVGNETFVQNVKDRMELNRLERAASGDGKGPGGGASSASPTDTGAFRPVSGQTPLTQGRSSFQEQTLSERAVGAGRNTVEGIQDADKALGRRLGMGQLPADASGLRAGVNTAGGAVLGAAAAYGSFQAGQGVGENLREGYLDRDMAAQYRDQVQTARQQGNEKAASILERTAEDLDKRGGEKYQAAATDAATFGGSLAVGAVAAVVAPTATGLAGAALVGVAAYDKTRDLLENTETGRRIDKGTEDLMDRGMQAGEALTDQVGRILGGESKEDRDRAQMTGRQASYDRALERGAITLRDGVSREDLLDYLKNRNPAPSEKDGYTAADYQAGLNELISKTPRDTASATSAVPQTGAETAGTGPVKSRQELDLEAYQALQALEKIKKDAEEKPVDKQTTSVDEPEKEPEKEPVKPEEDPNKDKGNQDTAGGGSDTAGGTPNQEGDQSTGTTDTAIDQATTTEVTDPNLVSQLRNAENRTGGGQKPGADPAALEVAMNTNVTGSFQQDRDQQNLQGTQQAFGSIGGTQAERAAAAQNQQMLSQSQVQAQGQLTTQAILAGGQEFTTAQQNMQASRQGSLGNILFGSLMGGLTSGVATGIDRLAGGIGSGAGQQVSANWGIQPPPPPPPPPTTVTPATTGTGSTGSQTTGTGSTGSQTTGGQIGSTPQAPVQTASATSGGSTTITRPPVTTTAATGGIKTCRTAGTCSFTKYADKNGCCSVCGKKVATISK